MEEKEKIKKETEELKKKLEECRKEKEEFLNGWKRARADFLNYKRDEEERRKQWIRFANEEMVLKILPILDNIHIAEEKISPKAKENDIIKGFLQIKDQFLSFLKLYGVKEIEALGKKFDPYFHDAVEEVDIKGKKESGIVVEEVKKGYSMNGKVIRPSKVKVSK